MFPPQRPVEQLFITVAIWHNTNHLCLLRGWHPADPMMRVYAYDIPAEHARNPAQVLEEAYETFNVGDDERAQAYRERSNRSLSVGDVVVIGEVAYVCASVGWELLNGSITVASHGQDESAPGHR
ncbi:hypothetical protein ACQPYK_49490 (plasmid) [Streptosporangium sp. CA-135522]|uniref:hypothetical protein n=1 Tax=Streptosporangium sp. CA-135522 TaxID=3240072 RepID=UPI003D8F743F